MVRVTSRTYTHSGISLTYTHSDRYEQFFEKHLKPRGYLKGDISLLSELLTIWHFYTTEKFSSKGDTAKTARDLMEKSVIDWMFGYPNPEELSRCVCANAPPHAIIFHG